jgi:hypothetical protein
MSLEAACRQLATKLIGACRDGNASEALEQIKQLRALCADCSEARAASIGVGGDFSPAAVGSVGNDHISGVLCCAAHHDTSSSSQELLHLALNVSDEHGATPLFHAARTGLVAVVEALVGVGASAAGGAVQPSGNTALHVTALRGHTDILRVLLRWRASSEKARACVQVDWVWEPAPLQGCSRGRFWRPKG